MRAKLRSWAGTGSSSSGRATQGPVCGRVARMCGPHPVRLTSNPRPPEFIRLNRSHAAESTCYRPSIQASIRVVNPKLEKEALTMIRAERPRRHSAVGYVRRSTDRQEQSIPDQKQAIETYSQTNG